MSTAIPGRILTPPERLRLRVTSTKVVPIVMAAAAMLATACARGSRSEASLPPSPPVVRVAMADYRFEHSPVLPKGRVVIRAPNLGEVDHELVLAGLPEDFPPIDEQLRGDVRRSVRTLATAARTPPGLTGTFAVDLPAGRYAFICFLPDPDGTQHFLKGMSSEFRVQ